MAANRKVLNAYKCKQRGVSVVKVRGTNNAARKRTTTNQTFKMLTERWVRALRMQRKSNRINHNARVRLTKPQSVRN